MQYDWLFLYLTIRIRFVYIILLFKTVDDELNIFNINELKEHYDWVVAFCYFISSCYFIIILSRNYFEFDIASIKLSEVSVVMLLSYYLKVNLHITNDGQFSDYDLIFGVFEICPEPPLQTQWFPLKENVQVWLALSGSQWLG